MLINRDEAFTSFKTPSYKLHYYETLTGYRFILLSDPSSDSLRFVLRQLYTGPFLEHVVRNPLIQMDDRTRGVDSDLVSRLQSSRVYQLTIQFRGAVDRHVKGLSMFS
jgi:hypothetical protein